MKKLFIRLVLAAALLPHVASLPCVAQEANLEVKEQVVTAVQEGDQVIINVDGEETIVPIDDYNAEKERGLADAKIANNKRISEADGSGIGVTIMSMCIVLGALIVLSVLFYIFGKVFKRSHSKRKREAHGVHPDDETHDDSLAPGEVIAAIGMALDQHFNSNHDVEDTVLTIRRMKRAYSPWNSKIYNMRKVPVLRKNK